jgi:hypothetical protein
VPSLRTRALGVTISACVAGALAVLPASALGGSGGVGPAGPGAPAPVPGVKAKLLPSGLAAAPEGAPEEVVEAIEAANSIDQASYCTGGGHKLGWRRSRCYDCSGAVSYVLGPKGADILDSPLPSGDLERWGYRGKGGWISVYANGGHAYVVIAGLRFDTSQPDDGESGPGWSKDVKAGLVNGPFKIRHWAGL